MIFKNSLFSFLLFVVFSCNNSENAHRNTLKVAVAANVQFAVKDIEVAFEKEFGKDIDIILGSSGKLTAQIKQGAPYDIFIAANMKYPNYLFESGLATKPTKIYALGSLVLWTMQKDMPLDEDLTALRQPSIQKIAVANPKNAPYGEQAIHSLQYYNLKQELESKLVFGESIAQINQYITTQNCEIGFTAKSVVLAPKMQHKGKWIAINPASYQPIEQGIILTQYGRTNHPDLAEKFYNFVFSTTAQTIFEEYGYTIPN